MSTSSPSTHCSWALKVRMRVQMQCESLLASSTCAPRGKIPVWRELGNDEMIFQLTLVRCDTSMTSNITLWRFFLFFPVPMEQNKIIIIIKKNPCITLNATAAFKMLPACLVKVNHATVSRRFLLSFFSPYLHYRQHISDFFFLLFRRWQPKKAQWTCILLWCRRWGESEPSGPNQTSQGSFPGVVRLVSAGVKALGASVNVIYIYMQW